MPMPQFSMAAPLRTSVTLRPAPTAGARVDSHVACVSPSLAMSIECSPGARSRQAVCTASATEILPSISIFIMKFILLALLVVALALQAGAFATQEEESTADFDDDFDSDEAEVDRAEQPLEKSDDSSCPSDPQTATKTLGGKEVSQETEQIMTGSTCTRVLKGGTPEDYTDAMSCSHCTGDGSRMSCVGLPLARSRTCSMVRGPDCEMHSVSRSDPTQACP